MPSEWTRGTPLIRVGGEWVRANEANRASGLWTPASSRFRREVPEQSSTISVVAAAANGYSGEDATWSMVPAGPGAVLIDDVVLVFQSINNGQINAQPTGWTNLVAVDNETDPDRTYSTYVWGRRVTANGTFDNALLGWSFFVNFTGSGGHTAVLTLRGVRNSGSIASDIVSRDGRLFTPGSGESPLASAERVDAELLAIAFGAVDTGTLGGAPDGWTDVLTTGVGAVGTAYLESRFLRTAGTTAMTARAPDPNRRSTAIVHAVPARPL